VDGEDAFGKEQVRGRAGRGVTLGVQIGDRLISLNAAPAEDDLLEALGQVCAGKAA
jgi:hypothetical protein